LYLSRLFEHAVPQDVGTSIFFRLENNALNDPVSLIEFSELVTQSTRDFLCTRVALHAVSSVSPPLAGAILPGGNMNAPKQKQGVFSATMSSNNALANRALENRDRFPTVQMEVPAINGSTTATVFPRGVEGTVAHPGGPLLYGMSVSSFLWTGIQSDRIWWKNLLVTNAGLSEEKRTRWQLFFKLTKPDAVRIEPARLRHRPAPKEGTQSYLWVMACEGTWVELYDKSHGCALLPTLQISALFTSRPSSAIPQICQSLPKFCI